MPPLLRGVRVQLSGSIPEKAYSDQVGGIESFVRQFAARVFQEGGTLIHGSHPSFIKPLQSAAEPYLKSDGAEKPLVLVRSRKYSEKPEELKVIEEHEQFARVEIIPTQPGTAMENLIPMREYMANRCDAVVAVGGKWYGIDKGRAGVVAELEAAIQLGKPGFIVGGFGCAAGDYFKDDPTISDRLRNGYDGPQNAELAVKTDPEYLVDRIVRQLSRLPLIRGKVTASGRLFRILALDGGGIRGAFTAAVLAKWAEMLGANGGRDLVKHFDLVAGTSTGAILAIGLAVGKTPLEILNFYKEHGPKIFEPGLLGRKFISSKYDSNVLQSTLEGILGTKNLATDSCCRLVIPTIRARHGKAEVIYTPHTRDRTGYSSYTAVQAALASSAAPTYFDKATVAGPISIQEYLDGGMWANNPVLPAIGEAVAYLGAPIDRIDVLSIGTLSSEADFSSALGKGDLKWMIPISNLFFASQETAAPMIAANLLTAARHLRVNQQTPEAISLDNVAAIGDMTRRGEEIAIDTFPSVRTRFFDGNHAPDWRTSANAS